MSYKKIFFLLIFLWPVSLLAQDLDARSPKPNAGTPQQRAADKKKEKKEAAYTKSIEKAKKQHLKNQTRNTRKMMRKSKNRSARWDQDRKEFFLKRWFRKKHR